jgi:hypothetical protein
MSFKEAKTRPCVSMLTSSGSKENAKLSGTPSVHMGLLCGSKPPTNNPVPMYMYMCRHIGICMYMYTHT